MPENSALKPGGSPPQPVVLYGRSLALFANFFFIILAYYQVKPASRALLLQDGGPESFPYVWALSALVLGLLIGVYHVIVERYSRIRVVLCSLAGFAFLLVFFRYGVDVGDFATAMVFYIFVDIFSVVLVEQFWSLANVINETEEGRRSYWLVGSGGLAGGVAGGFLASALIDHTAMRTPDLLTSSAVLLVVVFVLNLVMWRAGMYEEVRDSVTAVPLEGGWRALAGSRYLLLIAAVLCFSQLAQPLVEYQFISAISAEISETDQRTSFISSFFSIMGLVSIAVNVLFTRLVHRFLGAIAGMLVQPLFLAACSCAFMMVPTLLVASIMKISDRGLNYSINRASKELLYIPVDPVHTYQAKAWIDMFGYRLFKVIGSGLILLVTSWVPIASNITDLSWLTLLVCTGWIMTLVVLGREYSALISVERVEPALAG